MREYTYPIDEDGVIWHDGAEIDEPEIYRIFHRTMKRAPDGRLYATCQGERCWVAPADTPFVVDSVRVAEEGPDKGLRGVTLVLRGGVEEPLDPATLTVGKGNVLYTAVKGGSFPARFARKAYYELARWIVRAGDEFALVVGGRSYPIGGEISPEP
jgi:hypothetical protein